MSTCFVAGIVKGLVESSDSTKHFGSLIAYQSHLSAAINCGVVDRDGDKIFLTEKGANWYAEKRMSELPDGRSYMWSAVRKDDWTEF